MIDHRSFPGKTWPGTLLLPTAGACDLDLEHLLEVFGQQRRRFVAVLQGFGPDDWAAPTRCAGWSAHDVVRHLCDGNALAAGAGPDDRSLDMTAGFDPRITPRRWLTASAGESPDTTLTRFVATSGTGGARRRAQGAAAAAEGTDGGDEQAQCRRARIPRPPAALALLTLMGRRAKLRGDGARTDPNEQESVVMRPDLDARVP